jgi:methionyl-tRNA synthetase
MREPRHREGKESIFIGVAWPYSNGPLHLGHIAGAYLPADIFARFQRARGNRVLMVSGSDMHGTPTAVRAEQEGVSPAEIASHYHNLFLGTWQKVGISWDLYTDTSTENHANVVQDIFLRLLERGHILRDTMQMLFCPKCQRFLPDRYAEGTCPYCGYQDARGDQCDKCGKPLNANELLQPRCRICGTRPTLRDTEHFFLNLGDFTDKLKPWVERQEHWRPSVRSFTLNFLGSGLRARPITRDLEWGITVPVEGFESKRIYVWFEAVIGYLSASKEWAQLQGDADAWREWWACPPDVRTGSESRSYYFIGKDNIIFHTVIWPAMLMGYDESLALPWDVVANEHLTLERKPFSTSRNWAIWVDDLLSRYDPDPLRYVLSVNMPESADTDFSWSEFVRRNNDELVGTYGNLAHRTLSFTARQFEGRVPEPGPLTAADEKILRRAAETFDQVTSELEACHFRAAIGAAMALARDTNRYLEEKSPWHEVKVDAKSAATSLHMALQVIQTLKVALAPFLPFSSQSLHEMLGFSGELAREPWEVPPVPAGQRLGEPKPLFQRLDDSVVEQELGRLEQQAKSSGLRLP